MTTPTSTELVIPELADSKKLALITPESALAVRTAYLPLFATFLELEKEAKEIAINAPIAAKALRLKLTKVRTSADRSRKALGEEARRYKEACDEVYNILEDRLKPVEERLRAIEEAEKRAAAEKAAALKTARIAEITPFAAVTATSIEFYDLANMPDGQYQSLLASTKASAEARIAEVAKAESDRLAAEAAKEAERIRLAEENKRLAAEAAERQKALDEAKKIADDAKKLADETARKADAEKARLKKEADDKLAAQAKASADEAARVKKANDEKIAKDRADRDAKDRTEKIKRDADTKRVEGERAQSDAKAKAERDALAKQAEDARLEAKKLADQAKAREDADKAQKAKEAEAAQKAASQPDKAKLLSFAKMVRNLQQVNPQLTTPAGAKLSATITAQVEKFAKWVESEASKL